MKYYAVKKGREKGVFANWQDCQKQISGYSGAEYKSFKSIEEAYEYIGEEFIDYPIEDYPIEEAHSETNNSLGFTDKNWQAVLDTLNFKEIKNPNGYECYDILNEKDIPSWQYDNLEDKKNLYYFFSGIVYADIHWRFNGRDLI